MEGIFKKPEAHDLSPGLLRQRRNVMAISLIAIFLTHAGASFGSTSILGVELKFEKPEAIMHFVWMFLGYYIFRYYQYFRQEPGGGVTSVFYEDLKKRTTEKIHSIKRLQYPQGEFTDGIGYDFRHLTKKSFLKREFPVNVTLGEPKVYQQAQVEIDMRQFAWDYLKSAASVLVNTSRVTDYYLPFLLALFAIGYALV